MVIIAKFASVCPCCSARIVVGSQVEWTRGSKATHAACAGKPSVVAAAPRRVRMGSGHGTAAPVRGYSSYCTDNDSCRCYDCAS